MALARRIGLDAAEVWEETIGSVPCLIAKRYDRARESSGIVTKRLHQEDFCQALNVSPDNKYQAEGGPSLKDCFSLLREASSSPVRDLQAMLDAVVFNCLIGNDDAPVVAGDDRSLPAARTDHRHHVRHDHRPCLASSVEAQG